MACACSGPSSLAYEVRFPDGTSKRFSDVTAAQNEIRQKGGTIRAVRA